MFYRNKLAQFEVVIQRAKAAIVAFEQGQVSDRYLLGGLHGMERRYGLLDGKGAEIGR
jgi:hypothetical protein